MILCEFTLNALLPNLLNFYSIYNLFGVALLGGEKVGDKTWMYTQEIYKNRILLS